MGAVLLVVRPPAKEVPKDGAPVPGAVYYIEGSRDAAKAKDVQQKRAAFAGGQSVSLTEGELNALAGAPAESAGKEAAKAQAVDKGKAPEKGKVPEKAKEAPKAAASGVEVAGMFSVGAPNFRIHETTLQVAVPVTVTALDLGLKIVAQARGGIVKKGDVFAFEPTELYLGSCPVQRLPFLSSYVRDSFIGAQGLPDDVKGSWAKLASVTIEGNKLKLTMP